MLKGSLSSPILINNNSKIICLHPKFQGSKYQLKLVYSIENLIKNIGILAGYAKVLIQKFNN